MDSNGGEPQLNTEQNAAESVDHKLEETRRKIREMEEEDGKLTAMQQDIEQQMSSTAAGGTAADEVAEDNSVYVGQVDYEATPEELQAHFISCGVINRVTILCDKFTGRPKGYAYIEFASKEGASTAVSLNDSTFRGRKLKVTPKRQNVPGMNVRGGRGGRGRGGRGRGRGPPAFVPRGRGRGRRGGYQGYHPYY